MITILSPAKTFNEKPQPYNFEPTIPGFLEESEKLVNKLKKQPLKSLESLMSINNKLAKLNKKRYENWQLPFTPENAKPAAYLFRGEVYIGLDATTMSTQELDFAQSNLRILSGMYGLLRLMDLMQPYRLEMGTLLKMNRKQNLYEYWGNKLAVTLAENLENHQHQVLVNLASEQYFRSLQPKTLKTPVITPTFKEKRNGSLKSINVYAKRARGLMARFIINKRLEDPQALQRFDLDGYQFSSKHSDEQNWVFVRPHSGPNV